MKFPAEYLGATYTAGIPFTQNTVASGLSSEQKKALYQYTDNRITAGTPFTGNNSDDII